MFRSREGKTKNSLQKAKQMLKVDPALSCWEEVPVIADAKGDAKKAAALPTSSVTQNFNSVVQIRFKMEPIRDMPGFRIGRKCLSKET
ncbi:hypothetical protein CR513_05142 [Mucuna pruriens]|uniref:Uncharacterized protein n=1 Tax=Mucuna pruriens TaxID=157652 RepID=A0A371I5N2_MUCPR|nr:hypothetical protein CR513_05142 [Mucuna pruriens]